MTNVHNTIFLLFVYLTDLICQSLSAEICLASLSRQEKRDSIYLKVLEQTDLFQSQLSLLSLFTSLISVCRVSIATVNIETTVSNIPNVLKNGQVIGNYKIVPILEILVLFDGLVTACVWVLPVMVVQLNVGSMSTFDPSKCHKGENSLF